MSTSGWQIFVEVPGRAPIELSPGEAVIGRSRSCAVQIAESTVSRQHAVFVVEPGTVRLKDLGSSNGTYVNGKRVDGSIGLSDGDRVVIGEAELVVRILAPLGPAEATQKLSLPPLGAPMSAAPSPAGAPPPPPSAPPPSSASTRPAPQPAVEPPVSFRRTPTAVPGASEIPAAVVPTLPRPVAAPPPWPQASPGSPAPPAPPAAPAARQPEFAGLAPKGGGELLPSIQEIDAVPVPPAPTRKAPAVDRTSPAGFWIRVAAYLLDMIPIFVLMAIGVVLAFMIGPDAGILLSLAQGVLLFGYGVFLAVVMPALKGTTPGKKLLKLAIVSEQTVPGQGLGWGTALLRLVGHMVCGLTFNLGYLLVAFTAQKQGLHDLIAKTRVVRRS